LCAIFLARQYGIPAGDPRVLPAGLAVGRDCTGLQLHSVAAGCILWREEKPMRITLIPAALLSAVAAAQTTVTIPAQTITVVIPAQTITLPATTPSVTVPPAGTAPVPTPPVTTAPVATAPVVTAPDPGTFWVYYKGKFNWAGDYDFGSGKVILDNRDTDALSGKKDVLVSGDVGWQPYAPGNDFNTAGYNYITVSIKPTQVGNTWITGAEMAGDKEIPGSNGAISIMPYGPNPAVVGQWNTYKIPLSAYSIKPGLHIYKVMFLEQSSPNKSDNKVYFDNLGFVP
jgi:hypothetical protein